MIRYIIFLIILFIVIKFFSIIISSLRIFFSSTQKNPTSPQKKTSYNNVEDAVFEDISEKHP